MSYPEEKNGVVVALSILSIAMFTAGLLIVIYLAFKTFTGDMTADRLFPFALFSFALVYGGHGIAKIADDKAAGESEL